jgi:RNA polymerase sigma factor (sigma-70 family)
MITSPCNGILQSLRRIAMVQDGAGLTDAELLTLFIEAHDEAAFELLVRRHGPMVMGVCRRVLPNAADAEDAFQATFLVLVRKTASIVPRGMVGNWLHGVSRTTALKARLMNRTRRTRERQAGAARPQRASPEAAGDWAERLDEELGRLPDKYRIAVVLCDLEGRPLKEAAWQMGCPQGTVASRLARARRLLAARLARAGLAVSAGALAAKSSEGAALGHVPTPLMISTTRAAVRVAAGQAAGAVVPAKVATLAEGVVKIMFIDKLKRVLAALMVAALVAWGTGVGASRLVADPLGPAGDAAPAGAASQQPSGPISPPATAAGAGKKAPWEMTLPHLLETLEWTVTDVDAEKRTINLSDCLLPPGVKFAGAPLVTGRSMTGPKGPVNTWMALADLSVDGGAKVVIDGKEAKLQDLEPWMRVSLRLGKDGSAVAKIEARTKFEEGVPPRWVVKAVDAKAGTVKAGMIGPTGKDVELVVKGLFVEKEAKVSTTTFAKVGGGYAPRFDDADLGDFREGMYLGLELRQGADKKITVSRIDACK